MKIKHTIYLAAALSLSACAGPKHLEKQAKIPQQEAQVIALRQVPNGAIKEGELEKEKGKLVWSFDIAKPGTKDITEVHVDAITGAVVSVENETAKDEEKEAKEEAKEK